jgi:hypothetical protein
MTTNCEICVADGNRCHLGNITTEDGSVSFLGDKYWNLYLNSGKILCADHLLQFQESRIFLFVMSRYQNGQPDICHCQSMAYKE